eukprot:jgi/Picsp_1/4827/NSC_02194-R1_protein
MNPGETQYLEIGVLQTISVLETSSQNEVNKRSEPPKRRRLEKPLKTTTRRRSTRIRGCKPENLDEDALFRKTGLDDYVVKERGKWGSRQRLFNSQGPLSRFDSGLGVRNQGGRIYDSKNGITCHWCRQKTVEDHVICTNPDCGGGRTMPVAFCRMCLFNRHGECVIQSSESGKWVCPRCRGSCGNGCELCCNCGPCRKKHGLHPTHQIVKEARKSGFDNVHDYLVHLNTGEDCETIAHRKSQFSWGNFLMNKDNIEEEAESGHRDISRDRVLSFRYSLRCLVDPRSRKSEDTAQVRGRGLNISVK